MHLGVFDINSGPCSTREGVERIGMLAEELGYESVWVGEHVLVPSPQVPPSPLAPTHAILDPLVGLTFVAAITRRVKLGTGIIILPQRNPTVLAKQVASLDVLSSGRFILGLGVGYLEPEFRAVGVPLENRGRRSTEYLAAMRQLWSADAPSYEGKYVAFSGIDAYPRPIDRSGPPIVIGGHSAAAHRRAVAMGNGWYGWGLSLEQTEAAVTSLRSAAEAVARPDALGTLEVTVSPPRGYKLDSAVVSAYAELGVDRLVFLAPPDSDSLDEVAAFVGQHAPRELGL
jgi:probable F420-dependent oxidoreductase